MASRASATKNREPQLLKIEHLNQPQSINLLGNKTSLNSVMKLLIIFKHRTMIKRKYIPLIKRLLTITYLIGMFVSLLVHDHMDHVVSYQEADACERVIYYADAHTSCHHSAHYTKELEKCSLCDVHVYSPHEAFATLHFLFDKIHFTDAYGYVPSASFCSPLLLSNRGPPMS